MKDMELIYCLIGKLLSIIKITRPNIQKCVVSLFTTIDLPNVLLEEQKIEYRHIIHEEGMNVCIVISRRKTHSFQDIVL